MANAQTIARATDELTTHSAPCPLAADAVTADWPRFLGPLGTGVITETHLRDDLEANPPTLLWSYETGSGYAAPAIAEDRLVFAHRVGDTVHVDCLDPTTGKRFWRRSHPCTYAGEYISDSGPRASPVIDRGRVFVHSVEGRLRCFDLATGDVLWERNPTQEFGIGDQFFGVVSSPLIYRSPGNSSQPDVLIQNIGAPKALGGATVAAFDVATGEIVWSSGAVWGPSCASPVLATLRRDRHSNDHSNDRVFVVTGGKTRPPTGGLMVLDPADGRVILEHPFRSRTYASVNGASPVVAPAGDAVFLTAAYNLGTVRVDIDADETFQQAWRNRRVGSEFSTPLLIDGALFVIQGRHGRTGAVVAVDPDSGDERSRTEFVWDKTIVSNGSERTIDRSIGSASMIFVQDRALVLGDSGDLLWVALNPDGPTLDSRVALFDAPETWTPPVVRHGLLYICQNRPGRFADQGTPPRLMAYDFRASAARTTNRRPTAR
ncbi:MAG: PQQ-binding-like beta-propeller repeat protein [Planctomycetota bacterium]